MVNISGIIACLTLMQNKNRMTKHRQSEESDETSEDINNFLNPTPYVPFYQKPTYGYIKSNEELDKMNRGLN